MPSTSLTFAQCRCVRVAAVGFESLQTTLKLCVAREVVSACADVGSPEKAAELTRLMGEPWWRSRDGCIVNENAGFGEVAFSSECLFASAEDLGAVLLGKTLCCSDVKLGIQR